MDNLEIISRISKARTKANLSAKGLSLSAGLNHGYISKLESDKNFLPSMDAFMNILDACNMQPEEFFYYDIDAYQKDKEIITLLKNASDEKKKIILEILNLKK